MTSLTDILATDATLEAADKAMEDRVASAPPRASRLGMGSIGQSCNRKTWYQFRLAHRERFTAKTLKNFEDGHAAELVQAERLRLVPGVVLETINPATGKQFEYTDCNGHFVGKIDGKITGLLQAPKKLHIWEHKSTAEDKFNKLKKIIADFGEKLALKKWNPTYYAQAMLYCFYEGTDRHYMTVSTPGVRDTTSVRTEADTTYALQLKASAQRIISSNEPPEKLSKDPAFWECRFCAFNKICHEGEMPDRSCRTCLHSEVMPEGKWHCVRWGKNLTVEEQVAGCVVHKFIPALVPGAVIKADEKGVTYKLENGEIWEDKE
jgi:hypothetical protein